MSRKDYVAIAGALANARTPASDNRALDFAIYNIASVMAADNPRFDRQWFYEAAIRQPRNGRDRP